MMICQSFYKTLNYAKSLQIMFHKGDYDETKYLVLYGPEKYDAILDRIRYLIG